MLQEFDGTQTVDDLAMDQVASQSTEDTVLLAAEASGVTVVSAIYCLDALLLADVEVHYDQTKRD